VTLEWMHAGAHELHACVSWCRRISTTGGSSVTKHLSRAAPTPSAANSIAAAVARAGAKGTPPRPSMSPSAPLPVCAGRGAAADRTAARGTVLIPRAAISGCKDCRARATHRDSIAGIGAIAMDGDSAVASADSDSAAAVALAAVDGVCLVSTVSCCDAGCSCDGFAPVLGAVVGFADDAGVAGCAAGCAERGALLAAPGAGAAARGGPAAGFAAVLRGGDAVCTAKRAADARAAVPIRGAGGLADEEASSEAEGTANPCSRKRFSEARALPTSSGAGGLAQCPPSSMDGAAGAA